MAAILQELRDMAFTFLKIDYTDIENDQVMIDLLPHSDLNLVVIIPAFAEQTLIPTIESLVKAQPGHQVELIILINEGIDVSKEHQLININAYTELQSYEVKDFNIHVVYVHSIPEKVAGVGTARKLAMDEGGRRLHAIGKAKDGLIVNLDADCTVSSNYFKAIRSFFQTRPKVELANIHFEHRLEDAKSEEERKAIVEYELHLRYFIGMQKLIGLPFACQTIGSAFAVRSDAYFKIGGMNRRKAGEDFYFIHKFTKKGTAADLNDCTVYPSSRPSFRVPFGTGKAVSKIIDTPDSFTTYAPQGFLDLQPLVESLIVFFECETKDIHQLIQSFPRPCVAYLESRQFENVLIKLKANAKSQITFYKALFQWFDAFQLMKYLHFVRDGYYTNVSVMAAIDMMSNKLGLDEDQDPVMTLLEMRNRAKKSGGV